LLLIQWLSDLDAAADVTIRATTQDRARSPLTLASRNGIALNKLDREGGVGMVGGSPASPPQRCTPRIASPDGLAWFPPD
jgi:hypothetical protein